MQEYALYWDGTSTNLPQHPALPLSCRLAPPSAGHQGLVPTAPPAGTFLAPLSRFSATPRQLWIPTKRLLPRRACFLAVDSFLCTLHCDPICQWLQLEKREAEKSCWGNESNKKSSRQIREGHMSILEGPTSETWSKQNGNVVCGRKGSPNMQHHSKSDAVATETSLYMILWEHLGRPRCCSCGWQRSLSWWWWWWMRESLGLCKGKRYKLNISRSCGKISLSRTLCVG